ncbi:short-chain fatty acid transporter [Mycoplasmatota bacterium]|nr:short-chain fatty acid transporter [Mycoplasmatota bacterium]
MKKLFNRMTKGSVNLVEKYLPDPFIFAVLLTFVVVIASIFVTKTTAMGVVEAWYGGFWNLLAFSMQMALVLVTGTILATAPAFKRVLEKLASLPKNKVQAIIYVNLIALVACFINWGFGLVIGAIYAKEVAKQVKNVDYPLLIAAAYSGFVVWHAGISGSIPLKLATAGESLAIATNGAVVDPIMTNLTIFSTFNLIIFGVILVTLPFLLSFMHPKLEDTKVVDPKLLDDDIAIENKKRSEMTPAEKLENSRIINIILSVLGYAFIIRYFALNGFKLNLNIVNFIFLFTAILFHGTPIRVVRAVNSAVKSVGGIILQFPFYAGIMGIMIAKGPEGVSLAGAISDMFVNISTVRTFPLFTFLSAGIVNFFVPSGGGQWAVQAPIMMPAGAALNVDAAKTAMSIAWGDAWTNMIQPFWALPVLGIAKLGAKNIMGYCLMVLLYSGIVISLGLILL